MALKALLRRLAAGLEVGTGLVLIASPSAFTRLLFGSGLASPGPALRGMLLFSVLSGAYLIYRGIRGGATGPLLWPAAVLDACLGLLLARTWRRTARS